MTTQTDAHSTDAMLAQDDWEFGSAEDVVAAQDRSNTPGGADDELVNDPVYQTILCLARAGETDATIISTVVRKHGVPENGLGFQIQAARAVASRSTPEPPTEAPRPPGLAKIQNRPLIPTKSGYAAKNRRDRAQKKEQRIVEAVTEPYGLFRKHPEDGSAREDDMFITTLLPTKKQQAEGLFLMPAMMRCVLMASAEARDTVELSGATYTFNKPIPTRRRFRQAFLAMWKALSKQEWMADLNYWGKPEGFSLNVSGNLLGTLAKDSGKYPSTRQAREMAEFIKMLDALIVYENIPGRGTQTIKCFQILHEPRRQRSIRIVFEADLIRIIRNRNNMLPVSQQDFRLGSLGTILRNIKRGVVMKYGQNEERVSRFLEKQDRFNRSLYESADALKRSLKQQLNRVRSAIQSLGKIAVDAGKYLSISLTSDGRIVSRLVTA